MLNSKLGIKKPAELMKKFQAAGADDLLTLREAVISTSNRKPTLTWGIKKAAAMVGISVVTLRKLEDSENSPVGPVQRNEKDKRIYNLKQFNQIRE